MAITFRRFLVGLFLAAVGLVPLPSRAAAGPTNRIAALQSQGALTGTEFLVVDSTNAGTRKLPVSGIFSGTVVGVTNEVVIISGGSTNWSYFRDILSLETIADLSAWTPGIQTNFVVQGYRAAGDWGGPRFGHYDPDSVATIDNGCVFDSVTAVGRNIMDDCAYGEVNTRWFGATGDGTTDDTLAISNAIVYSVQWRTTTGGGCVRIPAGEYLVNLRIPFDSINSPSIKIRGDGAGATALKPYTNTLPVLTLLGRNIFVSDLQIKGQYGSPVGVGLQVSDSTVTNGVLAASEVRNLLIYDFDKGIECRGAEQTLFENVSVLRTTNALAILTRTNHTSYNNNVIGKVRFSRCSFSESYGDAITMRGGLATQAEFDSCSIEQNQGGAVVVEQTESVDGNPIRNFTFNSCFFEFNNRSKGPGAYYDIEFKPSSGVGLNANYTATVSKSWFQRSDGSHAMVRIDNPGQYYVEGNDYVASGTNFISLSNKAIKLRTDVYPLTRVVVDGGGTTPEINAPNLTIPRATGLLISELTDSDTALKIDNNGKFWFGDGTNVADLWLYRGASNVLRMDGVLRFVETTNAAQILFSTVPGDTLGRFSLDVDGQHEWGPGSAARDAFFARSGVGEMTLKTNLIVSGQVTIQKEIRSQQAASSDQSYFSGQTGDSVGRFSLDAAGRHEWGTGSATRDTVLARTASGTLTLGTNLVAGTITVDSINYSNTNLYDDHIFQVADLNPPGPLTGPTIVANSGRDGESIAAVFNTGDVALIVDQMSHQWRTGTTVFPHFHVEPQTADALTNTCVVKYSVADIGETFPTWTIVTNTVVIAGGQQWKHVLMSMPTNGIPMTGKVGPSTVVNMRVEWTTSADVHVKSADFRFQFRGSPVAYVP